jgi:ribosomal protein L11 methyltransferase
MNKYDININNIEFSIFKDEGVWGDGQHPSTQYMMDLICKYGVEGKSVIDIGTGTGILSVLCGKLGASHILALDADAHSLEWARKNFKRNNVDVEAEINNLTDYIDDKADVILANLPGVVQVENLKTVSKNLNDNGILIISWWNKLKFEDYTKGFKVIEHIEGVDDYDAYILKKKGDG